MLKYERVNFRIDETTRIQIMNFCCKHNVNISELMRDCLDYYLRFGPYNENENE